MVEMESIKGISSTLSPTSGKVSQDFWQMLFSNLCSIGMKNFCVLIVTIYSLATVDCRQSYPTNERQQNGKFAFPLLITFWKVAKLNSFIRVGVKSFHHQPSNWLGSIRINYHQFLEDGFTGELNKFFSRWWLRKRYNFSIQLRQREILPKDWSFRSFQGIDRWINSLQTFTPTISRKVVDDHNDAGKTLTTWILCSSLLITFACHWFQYNLTSPSAQW